MVTGLQQEHQPAAAPSYSAAPTPFESPVDNGSTPSLPQLLSDESGDSDSEYDSPIRPRSRRPTNPNHFYTSSSSSASVPGSVLQGEQALPNLEMLPDQFYPTYDIGSLGLSEADLVSPPPASALGLDVGDDDPFMDVSEGERQQDVPVTTQVVDSDYASEVEGEEQPDTPPLTPINPTTPMSSNGNVSEDDSAAVGSPSSTRLVPGPGSVVSDAEYTAAPIDEIDEEGEEELDEEPPSPVTPPARKRASSSATSTKKTFKDGLWEYVPNFYPTLTNVVSAINNPEFESDIYWAADGLSGEIPDRRQVGNQRCSH